MYNFKDYLSTHLAMIKLLISGFFLFIPFMVNAAIIQSTEIPDSYLLLLEGKKKKASPATDPRSIHSQDTTTQQYTELPDKSAQLIEQNKNHTPPTLHQRETSHNTKDTQSPDTPTGDKKTHPLSIYSKIKSFAKMLIIEYGDNELVQEALSTLFELKQLWNDTDSLINDFVYDVFFDLNLEDFLDQELAYTQHSLHASNIYLLSNKDLNLSTQDHKINTISLSQLQGNQTGTGTTSQQMESNFFNKLFQITTLYYLVALLICLSILQAIFNFISRLFP